MLSVITIILFLLAVVHGTPIPDNLLEYANDLRDRLLADLFDICAGEGGLVEGCRDLAAFCYDVAFCRYFRFSSGTMRAQRKSLKGTMLSILILIFYLYAVVHAAPTPIDLTECTNDFADRLLFSTPMTNFLLARNAQTPQCFDWTSDGCTESPDSPLRFDFHPACYRHDFGYRNYKAEGRTSSNDRLRIDDSFKADMSDICAGEGRNADACKEVATFYCDAVRAFGHFRRRAQ